MRTDVATIRAGGSTRKGLHDAPVGSFGEIVGRQPTVEAEGSVAVNTSDEIGKLWSEVKKLPGWLAGGISVLILLAVGAVLVSGSTGGSHTATESPNAGTTPATPAPVIPPSSTTTLPTTTTTHRGSTSSTSPDKSGTTKAAAPPITEAAERGPTPSSTPDKSAPARPKRTDHSGRRGNRTQDHAPGSPKSAGVHELA